MFLVVRILLEEMKDYGVWNKICEVLSVAFIGILIWFFWCVGAVSM